MSANHLLTWLAWTIVLSLASASSAGAEPLPEFYGVYAVDGGQMHELKFVKTTTLQLSPAARVIVFDKNIGFVAAPGSVQLSRMVFHRNEIDLDGGGFNAVGLSGERPNNPRPKVEANRKWTAVSIKERDVELRSKPVPNQAEMLVFAPRDPLPAGHYAVLVNEKLVAAFWVGPIVVDAALDASADCFDRESWATLGARRQQMLPCSKAIGGGGTAATGTTSAEATALTAQLTALQQRTPVAPEQPDKTYADDKSGVSFSYAADYELTPQKRPIIALLLAPVQGQAEGERLNITVTMSVPAARLLSPTLDQAVKATLDGTQAALTESHIAGPVPTKLGNADAQVFLVTGKEGGVLRQKAVTIAVVNKNILGVVLHATPDTFDGAWDAYRRVSSSYTLR